MQLFLLTNKDTHARAVVVAESSEHARHMRPDGIAVWEKLSKRWRSWDHGAQIMVPARPVAWWPTDLSRIHADALGRADTSWAVPQVLACDKSETKRKLGEGPDDTWGWRE